MYRKYIKRFLDFVLSLCALIVLSPLLLILAIVGAIQMKGNPFFSQERPGWHEKIFKLYKFRTMTNERGSDGELLPDEERLNKYGRFLRSSSLDELPELWCILKGDMSIIGPRPLLVHYLPFYSEQERHRHDVRPGLTNLVSIKGRNAVNVEDKFKYDIEYVNNLSFLLDLKIFFGTIMVVLNHSGTELEGANKYFEYFENRKQKETV